MGSLIRDLQYSLRMLRKNFGLSAVIILSIGLGIGVNTAIFALLNVILLRPLPGAQHPEQLVELYTSYEQGMRYGAVSYPDYKDWRNGTDAFSGVLAQSLVPVNVSRSDQNEIVSGAIVSANYFSVLGVGAIQGRTFAGDESDDTPNANPVAVISYGLWQRLYGGDPAIVGKKIRVNARDFAIVGIADKEFTGANVGLSVDIWVPLSMQPLLAPGKDRLKARGTHWLDVMGRMSSGMSIARARAKFKPVTDRLAQEFPESDRGLGITIVKLGEGPADVQNFLLPVVGLLMAVVFMIFLIACFNVANLLLSRGNSREGEVAVRLALGASRKSLIRLLLTESILLSVFAGIFALFLAHGCILLLARFRPPTAVPIALGLALDTRVVLFTLLMSLAAGVVFGVVPALRSTNSRLLSMLRNDGFFKIFRRSKLQNALVVVQIAMSFCLLVSAGLILRSLQFSQNANTGFKADNVLIASMDVGLAGLDLEHGFTLYKQVLQRVQSLPGIRSDSLAQAVPMELETSQQLGAFVEGHESTNRKGFIMDYNIVAPGYFRTMEIPLVSGRDFTEQDVDSAPGVVIVNESFARRYWAGADPIGKKISTKSAQGPFMQVIGVVRDSKYYSITEKPFPFLYLPFYQHYESGMVLHVATVGDPGSYISAIEREVQAIDHSVPVFRVRTMKDHLSVSLLELRGAVLFLGIFGMLALVLASVGLYALMAYSVGKRRSEIAIRMAVGAQRSHVLKLILKEGMFLAAIGLTSGLAIAVACGRLLSAFLYGVSPADPATLGVTSVFLLAVAFIASFIPAWSAMRMDGVDALRLS
jgi:predicted permease